MVKVLLVTVVALLILYIGTKTRKLIKTRKRVRYIPMTSKKSPFHQIEKKDLNPNTIWSWEEVLYCNIDVEHTKFRKRCNTLSMDANSIILRKIIDPNMKSGNLPCPLCEKEKPKSGTSHLIWLDFKSAKINWCNLAGIGGPLSICTKHKLQVQFISTSVS